MNGSGGDGLAGLQIIINLQGLKTSWRHILSAGFQYAIFRPAEHGRSADHPDFAETEYLLYRLRPSDPEEVRRTCPPDLLSESVRPNQNKKQYSGPVPAIFDPSNLFQNGHRPADPAYRVYWMAER